jgi:hypothetical protein
MGKRLLAIGQIAAIICFALPGCSSHSNRPETAPVRGRVTYQGKPVTGASVEFLCPGAPRPAEGTTDESGNYQLTTFEPNDGAVIGTHVVTVVKYSSVPEQSAEAVKKPMDREARDRAIEEAVKQTVQVIKKAEKSRSSLPSKYANRKTSDLHKKVVAGDNVIDIELVD